MTASIPDSGYFPGGMPYNRLGSGPRHLLVIQGLFFENKPMPAMFNQTYRFLADDYTVYVVLRKPGLPKGCTLGDMANDYAELIRQEFNPPLDVIGVSTGGSIVQHFAAEHPELVRRLVIHSSAHTLSDSAKKLQLTVARLAQERRWVAANALLVSSIMPQAGSMKILSRPLVWLASNLMSISPPKDPNDLVVTIEAEDKFAFKDRLSEITAPTLVIAGDRDPFYTPALFPRRPRASRMPAWSFTRAWGIPPLASSLPGKCYRF